MTYFLPLFSFFLFISIAPVQPLQKIDGTTIAPLALDNRIRFLMAEARVTGLAVTILNNNQIAYQKAFGFSHHPSRDTLRTNHLFYGASFSKAIFGYIVAVLVDQKIIDLDRPLIQYLDFTQLEFEKAWRGYSDLRLDERHQQITARMCLSHTTGFPNWRFLTAQGFDPNGRLEIHFEPGSEYWYSGEGILLLQYVVEHLTGKGLEQLAQELLFGPLKMENTSYRWQKRFEGNYCNGHTISAEVLPKDKEDEANAAGSLETTPEDYARFFAHILDLTETDSPITTLLFAPNIRIRSKAQFGPKSRVPTTENDSIKLSYGLGWGLLQTPYGYGAFKEGHGEGFQHYSILFPDRDLGIIIFSNSDNGEGIFKELLEIAIGDIYTPWKWENYIPYTEK